MPLFRPVTVYEFALAPPASLLGIGDHVASYSPLPAFFRYWCAVIALRLSEPAVHLRVTWALPFVAVRFVGA